MLVQDIAGLCSGEPDGPGTRPHLHLIGNREDRGESDTESPHATGLARRTQRSQCLDTGFIEGRSGVGDVQAGSDPPHPQRARDSGTTRSVGRVLCQFGQNPVAVSGTDEIRFGSDVLPQTRRRRSPRGYETVA